LLTFVKFQKLLKITNSPNVCFKKLKGKWQNKLKFIYLIIIKHTLMNQLLLLMKRNILKE